MKRVWIAVLVAAYATLQTSTTNADNGVQDRVTYDIAPGKFQDVTLAPMAAGTTLEFGNCNTQQMIGGLTVSVLDHNNVILTNSAQCVADFGPGHVYATFSARLGTEAFTVRITCPQGPVRCTGEGTLVSHHDFNGDLTNVLAAYRAIPTTSAQASILLINDPQPIFTDPDDGALYAGYGCSVHDDHPEGLVRLPSNRFAITTDFGNNGKLFLAAIGSKKIDDKARLATNIASGNTVSDAVKATDKLITVNSAIGHGRGHLGGAARSGIYVLTAAEADDKSVNGMISIVDTRSDSLRVVDSYSNQIVLDNEDGAAWVTSAKLPIGSSNPKDDNYIPLELQNAHVFISAGTAMKTTNVVYRPRDGGGYSALDPNDRAPNDHRSASKPSTEFLPWAGGLPAIPDGDNQASLLTQSTGEVYLMTLNGNVAKDCKTTHSTDPHDHRSVTTCSEHGTKADEDSNQGYAKLYRVRFNKCAQKVCFELIIDQPYTDSKGRRIFETRSYVDFARAAGSYIVATGHQNTEKIMVYGLWATKIKDRTEGGCEVHGGGPFLRMMEF